MTAQQPICDGCKDAVPAGQSYATIVTPGTHDRHLCTRCAHLVWRYLPDLIRHRDITAQAVSLATPVGDVRERALRMDLPFRRKSPLRP
jgi:hypothetical protein